MANKKLKKYPITPLNIVEDHNEVVPFIHRGIGSRHLPIDDIVFVHFDSHPDLLIPSDLKADDVFKKDLLYEKISIENWIIPLVYAGHISHVVWMKPPWCEQIPDQETKFYVGKCSSTGFIRTTCKENYFVSEVLYCPEEKLENRKEVLLSVVSIVPSDWKYSNLESGIQTENKISKIPTDIGNGCKHSCDSSENRQPSKRLCTEDKNCKKDKNGGWQTQHFVKRLQTLYKSFEDKTFVLDIDLDFFSTQNPFKCMYSEKVYDTLKELYRFTKPTDLSDIAIDKCVNTRQKQLSELKDIFHALQQDCNAEIEHPGKELILSLKESLMMTQKNPDFLLLHEAGCTCDDTELPEHISTEGEITQLMSAVQEILSHFHKPVMITMARSSITDEYCPPNQVESIQEQTLEMLQDLYLEINVIKEYHDDSQNV